MNEKAFFVGVAPALHAESTCHAMQSDKWRPNIFIYSKSVKIRFYNISVLSCTFLLQLHIILYLLWISFCVVHMLISINHKIHVFLKVKNHVPFHPHENWVCGETFFAGVFLFFIEWNLCYFLLNVQIFCFSPWISCLPCEAWRK